MSVIFEKHIFPKFNPEELLKSQMNGLGDPTLPNYQLLSTAIFSKPEYKDERFEGEYIKSFLNAAKVLAQEGARQTARPGMYVLSDYSYALPVLYLCRHCVELSLKRAIDASGGKTKQIHNLERLWNEFSTLHPGDKSREDRRAMKQLSEFVKALNGLDPTGTKLRYAYDTGGLSQDAPLFVSGKKAVELTGLFVEQIGSLASKSEASH